TYRFSPFADGFVEILAAEQTPERPDWFQGTADAVRQKFLFFSCCFNLFLWLASCNFYKKNSMWTVYIIQCTDGTYYTGCTSDMIDRLNRHNSGQITYTSSD
ncbi:MAG: GIY-YIG nuclease family protein, partial [Flavisolibacter sp.]